MEERLRALLAGEEDSGQLERLCDLLERIWAKRRLEVADKWKRTLPFGDYIVDRWKKAEALGFGDGASVYDSVLVFGDVSVGAKTWIGPFVILDGSGGLRIGSNCSISAGVQIYSHDSVRWATSGGEETVEYAETIVGDNCYVGPNTVIAKGVTIGDGCVIGANSLVLHDVAAGSKAYGSPCRVASLSASPSVTSKASLSEGVSGASPADAVAVTPHCGADRTTSGDRR